MIEDILKRAAEYGAGWFVLAVVCLIATLWYLTRRGYQITEADFGVVKLKPGTPLELSARDRQTILREMRFRWVDGALANALARSPSLDIAFEDRPEMVSNAWGDATGLPPAPNRAWPAGTSFAEIYSSDKVGRRVLLTGEPGAGKSVQLLKLNEALLTRAEQQLDHPIPIFLLLSSWTSTTGSFEQWIVEELWKRYRIRKDIGDSLVKGQQLQLLLDGLDEVRPEQQEACIKSLNRFSQEYGQTDLVITVRERVYTSLSTKLTLDTCLHILPLTQEQVTRYLKDSGVTTEVVESTSRELDGLAKLASSPLMIFLVSTVFKFSSDSSRDWDTSGASKRVLAKYIDDILENIKGYRSGQVRLWLAHVSSHMLAHNEGLLLVESLQPSWLTNQWHRIWYQLMSICPLLIPFSVLFFFQYAVTRPGLHLFWFYTIFWTIILWLLQRDRIILVESVRFSGAKVAEFLKTFANPFSLLKPATESARFLLASLLIASVSTVVFVLSTRFFQARPLTLLDMSVAVIVAIFVLTLVFYFTFAAYTAALRFPTWFIGPNVAVRSRVNEGVWLSLRNAILIAFGIAVLAMAVELLCRLVSERTLSNWPSHYYSDMIFNAGFLAVVGFVRGGGAGFIQHFSLRFIAFLAGILPWNLCSFLDLMAEHSLMERVGTAYMFRHRLLQESLAEHSSDSSIC